MCLRSTWNLSALSLVFNQNLGIIYVSYSTALLCHGIKYKRWCRTTIPLCLSIANILFQSLSLVLNQYLGITLEHLCEIYTYTSHLSRQFHFLCQSKSRLDIHENMYISTHYDDSWCKCYGPSIYPDSVWLLICLYTLHFKSAYFWWKKLRVDLKKSLGAWC